MEMGTSDPRNRVAAPPDGWVTLPGGGVVPAKSDRPTGWGDDRDTLNIARITRARTAMAEAVTAYQAAVADMYAEARGDMADLMVEAVRRADVMADAWHKFTEATGDGR